MTDTFSRDRLSDSEAALFQRIFDTTPRIETLSDEEWLLLRGLMLKGFARLNDVGPHTTGESDTPIGTCVRSNASIPYGLRNGWIKRDKQ